MQNVAYELEEILKSDYKISLYFVGIRRENIEYRKLNLKEQLANEFKQIAATYLNEFIDGINTQQVTVIDYDPGYKKESFEWERIKLDEEEFATVKERIDSIPHITNTALLELTDEPFIKSISYYILTIETVDGISIKLFRKYLHSKELTKKKGVKAIFNNGAYDSLEARVLMFDEKFDCFTYDGKLYISNTTYFHYIFHFYQELSKKASKIIDDIVTKIPIENVEELKSMCSTQPAMLSKIYSISRKEYFDSITLEKIQATISAFELELSLENGKIVFTKDKKWEVLKLLDEDYLDSMMTGNRFVSNSKQGLAVTFST